MTVMSFKFVSVIFTLANKIDLSLIIYLGYYIYLCYIK